MTSSDRRSSFSPSEQQRAKSRSSSQSYRSPPNIIISEEDASREKTPSQTSKPSAREINPTKRSESSTSNRSTTVTSPTSNISKRQRSSLKSSSPPITSRRRLSKRKKSSISTAEIERRQLLEPNNEEKQDLTGHGFAMIPPEIFDLLTLRRLNISYNNISSLPPEIGLLINLEYLDISHNPLIVQNGRDDYLSFPREFRKLKNLRTLNLTECSLKHIPVVVWSIVSLQILDLSRNRIGFIVSEIGNLIELHHLRLSQMDLDTLPPEIGFCDKLETFDLSGNPIDNLPETLIECRQLYELKLNYQTFHKLLDEYMLKLIDEGKIRSEHIPQVIFELESLQVLDLSKTKINSISNEHTLLNLSELYLSNNSFFDISESICSIEQLKILDLSHNRILTIPDFFIKMKQLEILNLSYNKLNSLSKILAQLPILKKLILNHNKLDTIENDFSKCQSLLTLDLSYNNLKKFSDELCELEQLETLDLRYNKIEYLPSIIRRMIGLRSMNTFNDSLQRIGLHVLGNSITDPPGYVWKSTDIKILYDYIEKKEKSLANSFYHLKLILIGPKNIGKTTFAIKLVNNRKTVTNTRNTIDMYVSILQEKQLKTGELWKQQAQRQTSNAPYASSSSTDQWIENRISTNDDYVYNKQLKTKRTYPPPLHTYRLNETSDYFIHKSTLITNNNFYCTIFDLANEPSFEILYPLIYDSNALYILPVNLTMLLNYLQTTISSEDINEYEDQSKPIDFNTLLTHEWLYDHIFRYMESISDHCEKASIAIVGLVDNDRLTSEYQQQQLLDEIHAKVNTFLLDAGNQRKNVNLYSELFSRPLHLDDEQMSSFVIQQLETIAQQWNIVHHKQKRQFVQQRFASLQKNTLIIDYDTYFKRFKQQKQFSSSVSEDENDEPEEEIDEELKLMSFDQCLDYLKLIGDILYFGQKPRITILLKPYYILNKLLSSTLFRPQIDQWLNYDDNMVFRFSGYYPSQDLFNIDRQRLLTRGEFTWKMLNVLFYEQNNNNIGLTEKNIHDYCRLMERLYLGYLNESNLNHREFTSTYFVCPWLMNEKCFDINYMEYFKTLEQERQYEYLQGEKSRRIKQQQLWFSMDSEQENNQHVSIVIPNLPSVNQIQISDNEIINQDPIQTIKILNEESNCLPNGLYERLLICLHPLFNERLDYYNFTIGRTTDKNLIKIQRFEEQNQIHLTINNNLLERIQNILTHTLFSFYPTINLRIET